MAGQRWGICFDTRVFVSPNTARIVVDAVPHVELGLQPAGRGILNVNPTIQFSNSLEPVTNLGVTAVNPSTLSGPHSPAFRRFRAVALPETPISRPASSGNSNGLEASDFIGCGLDRLKPGT